MAYRTYHMLTILGPDSYEDVHNKAIEILSESSDFHYAISEEEGVFCNEARWDSEGADMRLLSTHFPLSILTIHGEGEENTDLWRTYYKNGKAQHCPATVLYDEYDELKLA